MQDTQANKPIKMNVDKAAGSLSQEEAFYLLNHERSLFINGKRGGSLGKSTGVASNIRACDMDRPAGENYSVGSYRSPLTNEEYQWVYNSNKVHYIMRTSNDGCEVVYHGCLELSADPIHSIEQFKAFLKITKTCKNWAGKELVWVDGTDTPIGRLDVEASIKTNFFTTPFFLTHCDDPCEYIRLVVPKPCACISARYAPLPEEEIGMTNNLLDRGFKFIYRFRTYDNRVSEWSDPSTFYYQDSKGCFEGGVGFSRCMKLRLPMGNPMVDKIEIGFSDDNGMTWNLYDTIEKYNPYTSPEQQWYERTLSPEITASMDEECFFEATFCNNRQRITIPREEVIRVYNPSPRGAQGIVPINNTLGYYNYKKGNCPIDEVEAKRVKIELDCENANDCDITYASVTIRAVVHNTGYHLNQFVYRMKSGTDDDKTDQAWFGGLRIRSREYQGGYADGEGWIAGYDQYFRGDIRNFVVYIEGTEYWGEMKQWRSDRLFVNRREWGIVSGFEDKDIRNELRRGQQHGVFYYQEYTFRVPKGTSGFLRLQSHRSTDYDPDTSTFVHGTLNLRQYRGDSDITNMVQWNKEEIFFDTCNGDVQLEEAFVIRDNAVDRGLKKRASGYFGYITDENNLPVEGLNITDKGEPNAVRAVTDHNGFYHFYLDAGKDETMVFDIYGERDGGTFKKLKELSIQSQSGENNEANVKIYESDVHDYDTDYYALVNVRVRDCDGIGIGGVRVAVSGSKYGVTDAQGLARIRVRNHAYRNRSFRAVIADPNGCFSLDCEGNCNPCMPSVFGYGFASYAGRPDIGLPDIIVNRHPALNMVTGLKANGRYGVGFVLEGDDRVSAVYRTGYLDIPSTQKKNKLNFCDLSVDFADAKFEKWVKCIKVVRTRNLNPFVLQWVVDKIERTSQNKVRLTIQSLNEYNEFHNFKTNTVYSYLKGDRVEFIRNGDGEIFDLTTHGDMSFTTVSPFHDKTISGKEEAEANFFNQILIPDDDRLLNVKEGSIIEIRRHNVEQDDQVYYTVCANIPVINGVPAVRKARVHTFDTFIVNRKIGKFPALLFEHHSPSDFWINPIPDSPIGYSDIGKPHAINPYEDEKRYGRNITLSTAAHSNVFGYIEKTFDAPEQGDIIAMTIADNAQVLAVCENDWFTAPVSDNLLRSDRTGAIRVSRGEESIGDPQPKAGKYGCQYHHAGSVYFDDGFASWNDVRNTSHIICNWAVASPVSKGVVQSYFSNMAQVMERNNRTPYIHDFDKYRFITGRNSVTGALYVTMKTFRHSGIDNGWRMYQNPNNTIAFDPATGDCLGFLSFTPERYGNVEIYDGNGCAFLSYLHGIPYIHPENFTKINNFYGVRCDRVIGIAVNKHEHKIKSLAAIEIHDEEMWFVSNVSTDNGKYRSEIPPAYFVKNGEKWNAGFLGNLNTPEGLFGDERPKDFALRLTLVKDNTIENRYMSVNPEKQEKYDELNLIITKFAIVEQSGFTANL